MQCSPQDIVIKSQENERVGEWEKGGNEVEGVEVAEEERQPRFTNSTTDGDLHSHAPWPLDYAI